jgi:hypothetical protein
MIPVGDLSLEMMELHLNSGNFLSNNPATLEVGFDMLDVISEWGKASYAPHYFVKTGVVLVDRQHMYFYWPAPVYAARYQHNLDMSFLEPECWYFVLPLPAISRAMTLYWTNTPVASIYSDGKIRAFYRELGYYNTRYSDMVNMFASTSVDTDRYTDFSNTKFGNRRKGVIRWHGDHADIGVYQKRKPLKNVTGNVSRAAFGLDAAKIAKDTGDGKVYMTTKPNIVCPYHTEICAVYTPEYSWSDE